MSRLSKTTTKVQIVCPHCRRSYEVKIDLQRLYRIRPRAVCSRCGGKFEVIQRMSVLGDESAASSDLSERTTPSPEKKLATRPAPQHQSPVSPSTPAPVAPPGSPTPESSRSSEESQGPDTPDDTTGDAEAQTTEAPDTSASVLSPGPSTTLTPQGHQDDDDAHLELLSSSEDEDESVQIMGTLRAPQESDLERPLPWMTGSDSSVAIRPLELPKSAVALEDLLTEHARHSTPGAVDPIPILQDDAHTETTAPVVPTDKTR